VLWLIRAVTLSLLAAVTELCHFGTVHQTRVWKSKGKGNKNLAIGNRSRVSCAFTQYVEGIYRPKYYTVTWKSMLRVTQGHWKWNHWIDHTRLSSSRVIWCWILSWLEMSLEVTQGHWKWYHLKAVSYSPSIVTMAVSLAISEIFSVKEWPDLEIWVWGRSRLLKMARFDRPCMNFY